MQSCKYFGQKGNVAKLVKDTCPPPLQRGAYYFTLDLDAGQSSEVVLQEAQLLSPADAMCDLESGMCTASTGPGYDLYVAKVRFQMGLGSGDDVCGVHIQTHTFSPHSPPIPQMGALVSLVAVSLRY